MAMNFVFWFEMMCELWTDTKRLLFCYEGVRLDMKSGFLQLYSLKFSLHDARIRLKT
jgi:hypothetical protein